MIRAVRLLVLGLLALVLIVVALANRAPVTLTLLPEDISGLIGWNASLQVPLFLVGFAGVMVGLLIGFLWEWLREHKYRATASSGKKQVVRLERELAMARDAKGPSDEVLALLAPKKA